MAIASEGIVVAPRPTIKSVADGRSPGRGARRCPERGGRTPGPVAAGFSRRRHRDVFRADRRAALVARSRRDPRGRGACGGAAPGPDRARGRGRTRVCRRRFRADPVRGVAGRHADARPPARLGRDDRARHRYRSARPRLARRHRARPDARPCARRAAEAGARAHPADQRLVQPGRRISLGQALPGAGAGRAGRLGPAARAVFRRDRRGRLQLRRRRAGSARAGTKRAAAGANG